MSPTITNCQRYPWVDLPPATPALDYFDLVQRELVGKCELPHYEGIRHAGLAGTICEDLLLAALREFFASMSLNFDRGVIKSADANTKGKDLDSDKISDQTDIVVYKGEPISKIFSAAVIHISNVKAVVEVKKWTTAEEIRGWGNGMNREMRDTKKLKPLRNIPRFIVTFRYKDKGHFENWSQATADIENSYCFSGIFSRKKSEGGRKSVELYPWQEDWWCHFGRYCYRGEYRRLVTALSELS